MDIILRFRTHNILTADVAGIYRQIVVDKENRSLQRNTVEKRSAQTRQVI